MHNRMRHGIPSHVQVAPLPSEPGPAVPSTAEFCRCSLAAASRSAGGQRREPSAECTLMAPLCCGWCQGRVLGVVFGVVVDGASVVGAGPGSGCEVPMTGDRSAALD